MCTCPCHRHPSVMHIIPCCDEEVNKHPTVDPLWRNKGCDFSACTNDAVRRICYDSNFYENDKYAWACEECAKKYEVK